MSDTWPHRLWTIAGWLVRAVLCSRRMHWMWAGIFVGMFLLIPPTHAAGETPISLDTYWELLETTHTRLTELAELPLETARPTLDQLAAQWDSVTAVELPDGTILPVDTRYFSAQLRAEEPDLLSLTDHLAATLAARATWPQGDFSATALLPLTNILARPEFQWQPETPNPLQALWDRIFDAFDDFLARLFPGFDGTVLLPVDLIITIVGSILLIGIFLYILRGTWGNLIAEAENATNRHGETAPLTAEAARQRARELSQAGDHRTAIRYLYLASLLLLEERGLLRYDRTLTNRETLRSVQNRPDLAAPLQEVVETFDRVWYGYQEVDKPTFEHYAERVEDLRSQK